MPEPENPQIFNNRYEIKRKIARGGMADVFLAHDQLLDRPVALKMLFPELSTDNSFVERFRREAQSAANLNHPNIVSVYDWGEEGSTYFIVMEFIDGKPLSQIISAEGPLSTDRAAKIGAEVASALGFAHSNGVIHRDVKPGNVMIDNHGRVKVTDFGIARALNSSENLTKTGAVMGTATYFSPEQAQGHGVDPRSDVYSLGVILYEMAAGTPPFTGDNPVAIASKHVTQPPDLPSLKNSRIPSEFEAIIMTAMAKDPDNRYASAEKLRLDLERFSSGQTVAATAMLNATQALAPTAVAATSMYTAAPAPTGAEDAVVRESKETHNNRAFLILLLIMLAALGVLLFLLGRSLGLFGGEDEVPTVRVENVIGKPADTAASIIENQGLVVQRETAPNEAEEGIVFDQRPKGGATLERDSTVTIFISSGRERVSVPNVVGKDEEGARNILEDAGFEVTATEEEANEQKGQVLKQSPPRGTKAEKGSTVMIVVSTGVATVQIPDVSGQSESSAANELGQLGLRTTTASETSERFSDGEVIRTEPGSGTTVERGSTVTLVVSSGPPATTSTTSTTTTLP